MRGLLTPSSTPPPPHASTLLASPAPTPPPSCVAAVLVGAYVLFYLFMAGWMALHMSVMVGNMNSFGNLDYLCDASQEPCRAEFANRSVPEIFGDNSVIAKVLETFVKPTSDGVNYVQIGMPSYNGFFQNAFTTANKDGSLHLMPDPWQANERYADSLASNVGCTSSDVGENTPTAAALCSVSGQIRINNNWRMRTTEVPVSVTCKATPNLYDPPTRENVTLQVVALFNPWNVNLGAIQADGTRHGENVDFNLTAVNEFSWTWRAGHVFPHIMQFVVTPSMKLNAGERASFQIDCSPSSAISFENNHMAYSVAFEGTPL